MLWLPCYLGPHKDQQLHSHQGNHLDYNTQPSQMHPPSTQKRTNHLQGKNKEYPRRQKQSITCKQICSTKTNNKRCSEINREMKQCIQKAKPFKLKVALPDDLGPHLLLLFVSSVKTLFPSVQNSLLSSWNPCSPSSPANFQQISSSSPVSIFRNKPLLALLFLHQQAWHLQPPSWSAIPLCRYTSNAASSWQKRGPPLHFKKWEKKLSRVVPNQNRKPLVFERVYTVST